MKRVIVESPYENPNPAIVAENVRYARAAVRDCVHNDEAPIASHLLFTQEGILDDGISGERELGIAAGLAWVHVADLSVFYTDRGWSSGMLAALEKCVLDMREFEFRALYHYVQMPDVEHEIIKLAHNGRIREWVPTEK